MYSFLKDQQKTTLFNQHWSMVKIKLYYISNELRLNKNINNHCFYNVFLNFVLSIIRLYEPPRGFRKQLTFQQIIKYIDYTLVQLEESGSSYKVYLWESFVFPQVSGSCSKLTFCKLHFHLQRVALKYSTFSASNILALIINNELGGTSLECSVKGANMAY